MKDTSSVGAYASKSGVQAALNRKFIEQIMNIELQASITNMKYILPILTSVVTPVIGLAYQLQSMVTDINITKPYGSNVGIWQSSVGINAVTKEMHTEDDVTYTTISVPL